MFVHFGPADYNNITETTVDVVFGMEGDNMTSKSRYGITGNGNAMTTFATVIDIIKTYAWRERPHQFMMSAAEPSRVKLYKRMVNAIKIPGYGPAEQDDIDGTIVWYIKRIDK